jgi:uncharacterized protein YunC (DUF1805 family)
MQMYRIIVNQFKQCKMINMHSYHVQHTIHSPFCGSLSISQALPFFWLALPVVRGLRTMQLMCVAPEHTCYRHFEHAGVRGGMGRQIKAGVQGRRWD